MALQTNPQKPGLLRVLLSLTAACFVASILAGVIIAGLFGAYRTALWPMSVFMFGGGAFTVALPIAVIIGLPLYFALRSRMASRPQWAIITGGLLAAVPYAAFFLAPMAFLDVANHGEILLMLIPTILLAFALGGVGGWLFWLLLSAVVKPMRA
ncbi:hypothetical protein MMB232_02923 [Brevundimonas subvibrioides]|uniref:hypothetical protein n=1 Tax=Brevundimonas subvibrioides TaxID=74313 RepID=UPI0032D5AC28